MSEETLLYIAGLALMPAGGALIYIVHGVKTLVDMHKHPENTGFGTVGMKEVVKHNTEAIQDLTHYVRWFSEQQTGRVAPPPIPNA